MRKFKGSFTLEATIVISTLIMILFAVLYAFMIMYQYVVVTYAASYAAQQGAITWVSRGLDINTGAGQYQTDPYYRVAEIVGGGSYSEKKTNIENCVRDRLRLGILNSRNADIDVEMKNYLFQRQIHVEIKQEIPIPFDGIAGFFNNGEGFVIKAKSIAAVPEPAEYIRNVDYISELVVSLIDWVKEKLGLGDAFETIDKVKGVIGAVLE